MKESEIIKAIITDGLGEKVKLEDVLELYYRARRREEDQEKLEDILKQNVLPEPETRSPVKEKGKEGESPLAGAVGRGKQEKIETFNRLQAYRKRHGVGWRQEIKNATKGKLKEETIQGMLQGNKYPLDQWHILSEALDKLGEPMEKKGPEPEPELVEE